MKVRLAQPKPCERKGEDNSSPGKLCECFEGCYKHGGHLRPNSKGTMAHAKAAKTDFIGCFSVEEYLIAERELRYDGREVIGLDVLFNGIDKIQDFKGNASYWGTESNDIDDHASSTEQSVLDFIVRAADGLHSSESFESREQLDIPQFLHLNTGKMADVWSSRPADLLDSMLRACWIKGVFDNNSIELKLTAYLLMKHIDSPPLVFKIWPQYTKKAFEKNEKLVWQIVDKHTPDWANKFTSFLDSLTVDQKEAIKLEWFYEEDEKPTQEELAESIGIGVDAFKARLKLAYKKLEKTYPEFDRLVRRKKNGQTRKKREIHPLYRIVDGERIEIEPTKARYKKVEPGSISKIKKWAFSRTEENLRNISETYYSAQEHLPDYYKNDQ